MADINVKVFSQSGEEVSTLKLAKEVFGVEVNEAVIFDAIMTYQANKRQATAKTKKRFEVSGGGKKPFRQKGTGRARAGSTRSPIWVGGGTVFGPTGIQSFKIKQNKKEYRLALKGAYSLKAKKDLIVLDSIKTEGKTKDLYATLKAFKLENEKVLLVSEELNVIQAATNLANVSIKGLNNVGVYDLMNATKVLVTKEDIKTIEGGLK